MAGSFSETDVEELARFLKIQEKSGATHRTASRQQNRNTLYNGPRNLDTKRGENKIYSRHDEKTVYRRFQGESRSGTLERREDAGTNCLRVCSASDPTEAVASSGVRRLAQPL